MFRIRQEHLEFLEDDKKKLYMKKIAKQLRDEYQHLTAFFDDNGWEEEVIERLEKAIKYGLNTVGAAQLFVELTFDLGMDFEELPRFSYCKRILESKLSAEDKYFCLVNTISATPTPFDPIDQFTLEKNAQHIFTGQTSFDFDIDENADFDYEAFLKSKKSKD